ncbi:MAG: PKD domain-containing protein [Pirellulales bacterium]
MERRRVLDGAVTSLVVSTVTSGDSSSSTTSTATATTTSTSDTTQNQPLTFNWSPPPGANHPASQSADLAQAAGVGNTPPVLVVPLDQNANEGQQLDLSGQNGAPPIGLFIDPDFNDTHTATIDWGDGSPLESATIIQGIGSGALGGTHTYADQGTYTVTISVIDSANETDTGTFDVIVAPVAPTATLTNNGPVNEGAGATVSFTNQFDPSSADTSAGFHYAYDLNNDGTFDVGDGTYAGSVTSTSQNLSAALLGDGPSDHTITARIIDKDGQFTNYQTTIHVGNAAPTLTNITGDTIDEHETATISATIVDPSATDTFEVDVDWLDGSAASITGLGAADSSGTVGNTAYEWTAATRHLELSHQYLDDGPSTAPSDTYNVSLVVRDNDLGSSGPYVAPVIVNDLPPVLVVALPQNVFEGDTLDLSGVSGAPPIGLFIDNGTLDTHTATVNWGDGSATQNTAIIQGMGAGALGASHIYADDGVYTVTVTVTDKDGKNDSDTFTVTVGNRAPVVQVPHGNQSVSEGGTVSFSDLATFTDPGFDNPLNPNPANPPSITDPLHESFTYDIDWGDGRDAITGASIADLNGAPGTPSSGTISGSHTYADDGVYQVTVTVHDDNGGSNSASFTVTVNNANPVVNVPHGNQTITEGGTVSFSDLATFTDPGFDNPSNPNAAVPPNITDPLHESFTYDIDWGDGRDAITGASIADLNGAPGMPSSGTIAGSHTYADDGVYQVTVTVHDDNGGVNSASFTVTVNNANPVVTTPHGNQNISEGGTVSFSDLATFTDPGFDNPLNPNPSNPPSVTDPLHESFTYDIDWGDGRDAITGASIADLNGAPGMPSSGTIAGSHTYADDGSYTVTITVHDDNGGVGIATFKVLVTNVEPTLTGTSNLVVNEGQTFTLNGLGVGVTDPGFDNPLNTLDPSNGGETAETLSAMSIDWGDGTGAQALNLAEFQAVPFAGPTTGTFPAASHTYADNGTYTVTVTVKDDDMASFVERTFTITVQNVAPTLSNLTSTPTTINEAGSVHFDINFSDPGFDNPLNTLDPSNGGEVAESFTFDVNWGDGRQQVVNMGVADANGSPGIASTGTFDGTHIYADDGTYTVTLTIHDDDGGSHTQTFQVIVNNVAPAITSPLAGVDVTSSGVTHIQLSYNDPGFDNSSNPNGRELPNITDRLHESFTHVITWGDGSVDAVHTYAAPGTYQALVTLPGSMTPVPVTITVTDVNKPPVLTLVDQQASLNVPGTEQPFTFTVNWDDDPTGNNDTIQTFTVMLRDPVFAGFTPFVTDRTVVLASARNVGGEGVFTTGNFDIQHQYLGPPDPLHPTQDIPITVTVVDDNMGAAPTQAIAISNPGIDVVNVAIDTTPDVPRLVYLPQMQNLVFIDQQATTPQAMQNLNTRVAISEVAATSDRYLELVVISPEGKEMQRYRLRDEAITDLRGFIATLPDNHYKIYLIRTDNNSRRLVIDVYVRRGRAIDPSDSSEGTRDRPPEGDQLFQGQPPEAQPDAAPESTPPFQTQPLDNNPRLERLPSDNAPAGAQNTPAATGAAAPQSAPSVTVLDTQPTTPQVPSATRLRWAAALTAVGIAAARGSWSGDVVAAFDHADDKSWQRLRRAARTRLPH